MRLLIFSLIIAFLGSCNMNNAQKESKELKKFESVQTINNVEAEVRERAGVYFLQVMNNGRELRYVPLNLDDAYKIVNTWVKVSGEVGQLAADSKALGFPMKITEISQIEREVLIEEVSGDTPDKAITESKEEGNMKLDGGEKRELAKKSSIDFSGSKLTVNRSVTHELGVLVSRGSDGKTWLIEQYKNGQVYNRLIPINLTKEFMIDGLQIEFDGHIGNPPPNVRLMGSPIHLEYIAKYKGEDLKVKKKTATPTDKGDSKFK